MFLGSFAWSFVFVSLPFHVQAISTLDPVTTLWWTGWILGISSLVTVVTSPAWARLSADGNPKTYYLWTQLLQAVGFFGMAIARTLVELFLARLVLGFMGAASTFAFMMAGRSSDGSAVRREVAAVQSAMTVGQVIGPLAGAVTAASIGFRTSFVIGGLILVGCGSLVRWGVVIPVDVLRARPREGRLPVRDVAVAVFIVLVGSTQIFFLTSILPQILPGLGVPDSDTLQMAGVVAFASGAAAALGSLATPRLAEAFAERRLVTALMVTSSLCLAALAAVGSAGLYTFVRFLQVLCIAPVFPLVATRIVQYGGGQAIGLVNSARIGAAFIGPVLATSILAWASPLALYAVLAGVGLACVPLTMLRETSPSPVT
jgi:MFS family permease